MPAPQRQAHQVLVSALLPLWADQNGMGAGWCRDPTVCFFADDLNQGMTILPLPDLDESLLDCIWKYRRSG
ncbi:hypothetical protein [Bradyrhizobium elkanii]|uniref:hypothetical protein n=1 Tax=Bradyrhizobium elkanii TaxID=29448 RepID=UPI002FF37E68